MRDPELLRDHGAFIAEGRLVVERLLAQSHFRARSVLVTQAAHATLHSVLDRAVCPVYIMDAESMEELAGFNVHRGCLAVGERGRARDARDLIAPPARLLKGQSGPLVCLEQVGNPDNVGGVFRNAAAFGASGIILSPGCADPLYRKSIRTSMGSSLIVPFAVAKDWPRILVSLRNKGWKVAALTLSGDAEDVYEAFAPQIEQLALVLGHEGTGLTMQAQALASVRVRIPTTSAVDSLNVAAAAAIALYEATSRRVPPPPQAFPQ